VGWDSAQRWWGGKGFGVKKGGGGEKRKGEKPVSDYFFKSFLAGMTQGREVGFCGIRSTAEKTKKKGHRCVRRKIF